MKKIFTKALLLVLLCNQINAQTEQENNLKYWNFRDNLKRKYLKIGSLTNTGYPDPGVSIPIENLDNLNINCGGNGKRMRWGDATLHQGYYIAMLASEYELSKRAGKDGQGTLNELYYALAAINRLDEAAESYLNFPNGALPPNLNGFLMRDDVPGNFNSYFQDPGNIVTCISSAKYDTENGSSNNNFHSNINEMSQDQIYGLLFGFSFVKKFIPPGLVVQPTPQDAPINLVDEVMSITDRIMAYCEQQWTETVPYYAGPVCRQMDVSFIKNWTIKNPITNANVNRGANMAMFVPYAADQANLINGLSYNGSISYGISFPGLEPQCIFGGPTNLSVSFPHSDIKNTWNGLQNLNWSDFKLTLHNLPKINWNNFTLSTYDQIYDVMDNNNRQMMLSLVSCTNNWTKANTGRLAWDAKMEIFDLVRSVLHGGGTWAPQSAFFNELSLAPCEGPNSAIPNNTAPWRSASHWWKPDGSTVTGEFNGIDYMLFYNLYMLEFGSQIPNITFQNLSCPCTGSSAKLQPYINVSNGMLNTSVILDRKFPDYANFGISVPEYLTQHLTVNGPTNLEVKTEFIVCNNSILKTWSNNSLIIGTPSGALADRGILRVRNGSQFWLESNGEVILHPYSKIIIEKGGTFLLRHNAKLVVNDHAEVIVEDGASFIYETGPTIVMQGANSLFEVKSVAAINIFAGGKFLVTKGTASAGGTVNLHNAIFTINSNGILRLEDATLMLSENAQFSYSSNATIELTGQNATLFLNGLAYLDHNAVFSFSYPNSSSGQLRFGDLVMSAGNNCKFNINGSGKSDVILQLSGNVELPDNLGSLSISNGIVEGYNLPATTSITLGTGSDPVNISNCVLRHYNALQFFGQRVFISHCDFEYNTIALADYFTGGLHHNLSVLNSNFSHCQTPVYTTGIGTTMYGCNINENDDPGWTGLGMSYNSYITNCTFKDNGTGNSTGIQLDYNALSSSAISIKGSSIENTSNSGDIGINGSGGNLNLRCNTISGNKLTQIANPSIAIYLADNANANLSSDFNQGYNNLSQNASLLYLNNSSAELNNGFNDFSTTQNNSCYNNISCVPFVRGSMHGLSCNGNNQLIAADQNYWGKNITFHPGTAAFDVVVAPAGSCPDNVDYRDLMPAIAPPCPLLATNGTINGSNVLFNGINVSTINTIRFPQMKLNNAVNNTIALMDTAIADGFKSAVIYLTEILNYPLTNPTEADKYILQVAYQKLMESLSQASYFHQIPDSFTLFHSDILNRQSAIINNANSYTKKVYTTMDKAAVYHLAGSLSLAIATLQNLSTWADPAFLPYVNEWLCYFNAENDLRSGRIDRKAFIKTIGKCRNAVNPRFGDSHNDETATTKEESEDFLVFPNPNNGSFNVRVKNNDIQSVNVFNTTGQSVYRSNYGNENHVEIPKTILNKGIFLVKVISNSGKVFSGKIIIE